MERRGGAAVARSSRRSMPRPSTRTKRPQAAGRPAGHGPDRGPVGGQPGGGRRRQTPSGTRPGATTRSSPCGMRLPSAPSPSRHECRAARPTCGWPRRKSAPCWAAQRRSSAWPTAAAPGRRPWPCSWPTMPSWSRRCSISTRRTSGQIASTPPGRGGNALPADAARPLSGHPGAPRPERGRHPVRQRRPNDCPASPCAVRRRGGLQGPGAGHRRGARPLPGNVGGVRLLRALEFGPGESHEIVIVGDPADAETRRLPREVDGRLLHGTVLALIPADAPWQNESWPLLAGRPLLGDRPTAHVCKNGVCELPADMPAELAAQLDRLVSPAAAP